MNNMHSRNWDEKRDFIRMKVDTQITLAVDDSEMKVEGYCRDLSGTGMLIEVDQEVGTGTTCSTTLPSNNEAFPSLDAKVKVLRCIPLGDDKFQLGAEILEIAS
tara:strand:- start:20391 stop:20702 length:312 start_codon:yes stop_codon:yes gene_type:complete